MNKAKNKLCLVLGLVLLTTFSLTACGAAASDPSKIDPAPPVAAQPKADFEPGKVIDKVSVTAHPATSYALYLPANYTHEETWPVLFFFDSQGDGGQPVKRYKTLADMFGVVLIGSLDSRNGMPFAQSLTVFDHLLADAQQKLSLDAGRIFAAGFSGGARVAAGLAQNRPAIFGVIGCAAGFQPRPQDSFRYVGLVGVEDFNYQEMRQLDENLDQTNIHHLVDYFIGGHEWPHFATMAKGLQFLQIRAMGQQPNATTDTLSQNMILKFRRQDEQLKEIGTDYQRWLLRKKIICYLDGISDVSDLQKEMAAMASAPGKLAEDKRLQQELIREDLMRKQYGEALETQGLDYWKRASGLLRKVASNGTEKDAWLHQRILNFLSLNAYFKVNSAFQKGQDAEIEKYLQIYTWVDPSNTEHRYLSAVLLTRQSRKPEAIEALRAAVKLGFDDIDRLESDPNLLQLRSEPDFGAVISEIKAGRP